jgi:hypothetical protein
MLELPFGSDGFPVKLSHKGFKYWTILIILLKTTHKKIIYIN